LSTWPLIEMRSYWSEGRLHISSGWVGVTVGVGEGVTCVGVGLSVDVGERVAVDFVAVDSGVAVTAGLLG